MFKSGFRGRASTNVGEMPEVTAGRNGMCPCGSGKKAKKCCGLSASGVAEPGSADAQFLSLARSGHYGELEVRARERLVRQPDAGPAWQWLGLSLWKQGKDALDPLERAAALMPQDAQAQTNLGNLQRARGRLQEALGSHQRALTVRPDYADAHNNLGSVLRDLGRFDAAAASFRLALSLKPDFTLAQANLAATLKALGQLAEAADSYRAALASQPDRHDLRRELGDVELELGRSAAAATSYRHALAANPESAELHSRLAMALVLQGCVAEGETSCRRALDINPNLTGTLVLQAQLRAEAGQFAEAQALFARAVAIDPDMPEAWAGLARVRKMTDGDAVWLAHALRIVERPLAPRREAHLRYSLGKYFDDLRDFERAFANYRRANQLRRHLEVGYDRRRESARVNHLRESYDAAWLRGALPHADPSERPVFIVGMWRSGTSLAEQILASHPSVFGAGELAFWNFAADSDGNPGAPGPGVIGRASAEYLRLLGRASGAALRVVDKMSNNFMHLGLIHAALPRARIIHLRRNPLDTCLSIHFQNFLGSHPYAHDLADLAHHFACYRQLMRHWRQLLPADAILDLRYEDLVGDAEAASRRMVEFIGLPWDPRCLEFHRTDRAVRTASNWQVRQPIHESSVARWRHYEKFLGPLLTLAEDEGD